MKKNWKKVCGLILAGILGIGILSACGDAQQTAGNGDGSGKITKDPLELTIHLHYWDTTAFDDNWEVFQKAGDITNIYLKGTVSKSATDSKQVFNLMMASGDLPDIIHTTKDNVVKYGTEGAFIPLNDLIEEYAPNIKQFLDENPEARKHMTAPDGNIYGISFIPAGKVSMGYFIRQDWLDKLGLEVPKTVDEFKAVLKAFKEQDPNGNGLQDEIPFFAKNKEEAIRIINLFGGRTDWYAEDGVVHYGLYDPEYKDCMVELAQWYKEGLIDAEIFTRGTKARDELLGGNLGGATHDWMGSTAVYNDQLKEKVPGINFVPIAPPADVNGKVWEEESRPQYGENTWGISMSNKHPEETMQYFDFWFGEVGTKLMNFGIEGEDYTMQDGKPVFTDAILHGDKSVLDALVEKGGQIEIGFRQDFWYEEQWLPQMAKDGMKLYEENGYLAEPFPMLSHTPEEMKVIEEKWPAIETYIQECQQKWLLGAEDPGASFDTYIEKLKSMGMDEVLQVYQAAYDRYQNQ